MLNASANRTTDPDARARRDRQRPECSVSVQRDPLLAARPSRTAEPPSRRCRSKLRGHRSKHSSLRRSCRRDRGGRIPQQLSGLSLGDEPRRPFTVESLLDGRVVDDWRLGEVANQLRLPTSGPFVVVAAEVSSIGNEALPGIESKLRSLDAYSAWQLLPDLHVGIVHIYAEPQLDKVLALVSRLAAAPVGVSAPYDDLRDTPQALHFAKVMLHSRSDRTSPVALFDGSILAAAAASAPAVMIKSARAVLDGLADLTDEERDILFETFRVWQDNEASADSAAKVLFCHPNTVRQRLRRIEKHTGRSLSRPRDVAELCLALEVHYTLIRPMRAS